MNNADSIASSRSLWNRAGRDLESDEVLAQILDRGEMTTWRALYQLARGDRRLRARIAKIVRTVPVPLPRFWLAALAALGEDIDLSTPVPDYFEHSGV